MPLTVRRFRVQGMTGEVRVCMLVGDLHGDEVRNGDTVRIRGRRDRHGVYRVRSLEILTGPGGTVIATAESRPPAAFRTAFVVDVVGKVVGALVLVWLAVQVVGALT
jgi:hypothetical protein